MTNWRCNECRKISAQDEILTAPSPFDAEETLYGCPRCHSVECFTELCDEPDCTQATTCGWPTKDGGYRRTCSIHARIGEV